MKKKIVKTMLPALLAVSVTGCSMPGKGGSDTVKLDPDHPVSLTIWHYYNGAQQATFDTLVKEFNASVGKEEGIYVEGYSQGSVSDLEQAVTSSLNEEVGADELPDIFSSYADTAYAVQKQDKLADLTEYFTEEEFSKYVDSYIDEGYFNQDGKLYLLPVAKSTEIMMVDKTDWEPFAEETGTSLDELATTEGITEVAQRYYEWTDAQTPDIPDDGKVFYGRFEKIMEDFDNTMFYTPKSFENGYSTRKVLDYNLSDKLAADKEAVDEAVASGTSKKEALKPYLTDEAFEEWYAGFCDALEQAVQR